MKDKISMQAAVDGKYDGCVRSDFKQVLQAAMQKSVEAVKATRENQVRACWEVLEEGIVQLCLSEAEKGSSHVTFRPAHIDAQGEPCKTFPDDIVLEALQRYTSLSVFCVQARAFESTDFVLDWGETED